MRRPCSDLGLTDAVTFEGSTNDIAAAYSACAT